MCFVAIPAAVMMAVTVAMTASQAAMQYQQQQQAAEQQNAYNKTQADNVRAATINNYNQAETQLAYHNDAAANQIAENERNTRSAEAEAMASTAQAGVTGNSVTALAQEYQARAGEFTSDVEYNRNAADNEIQLQMQGFSTQGQSEINSLRGVAPPSLLGPALQIGGSAVSAYGQFSPNSPRNIALSRSAAANTDY